MPTGCAGQFKGDVSPLRYLEIAAEWYATAIKVKPKDAKLHFSLAQVLEEQFYCEDLYGIKPQLRTESELQHCFRKVSLRIVHVQYSCWKCTPINI